MSHLRLILMLFTFVACTASAQNVPRIFITSVAGTGDLSSWPDAHGFTGLDAGDEICRTRAAAGSIPFANAYVALLSSNTHDAYCRLHGLGGKRISNCGLAQLPGDAGPWYRMDGLAAWDIASNSMLPGVAIGYVPRHIRFNEFGQALPTVSAEVQLAFTGTYNDGSVDALLTCDEWKSALAGDEGKMTSAYRGAGSLNVYGWSCNNAVRLVCAQVGANGPALIRSGPPNPRVAFITSSTGNGNLSSWPDAGGATGVAAADSICRVHAQRGGLASVASFKAWISVVGINARDRFVFDGAWYRPDGVRIATSKADLTDGELEAPLQVDEMGRMVGFPQAWTATSAAGVVQGSSGAQTCQGWTDGSNNSGATYGTFSAADVEWSGDRFGGGFGCTAELRLYCLADTDELFVSGFEAQPN